MTRQVVLVITTSLLILSAVGCHHNGGQPPSLPTPDSFGCTQLIEKPPRGLATLHCPLDQARPQCEKLVQIVGESCIDKPALNFLVDDTFGFKVSQLNSYITLLSQNGRKPHVEFYLYSGPTQRRCNSQTYGGWQTRTCPESFRWDFRNNPQRQEEYRNLYRRLGAIISKIHSAGGRVQVAIGLEDNCDDATASKMIEVLRSVAAPGVEIVRNPCVGCWPGNQGWIPPGVLQEDHVCDPNYFNYSNGIVTNDGKSAPEVCPYNILKSTRNKAGELGNWFYVWSAKRQGLTAGSLPDPNQRNYVIPTEQEKQELMEFLRQ